VFEHVLLVSGPDGATIGTPAVVGAKVVGTIVRQFRDKKIIIQKFRRRKNMRRKRGHRQPYTTVKITSIAAHA
jgi:large subunit ribosomal protein L21